MYANVGTQNCLVKFKLDGKYSNISGVLGLDDEANKPFFLAEVYADGKLIGSYTFKDCNYSSKVNYDVTGVKEFAVKGYGFTSGDSRLDLAGFVITPNTNTKQNTSSSQVKEFQMTNDKVSVMMSVGIDMIGVTIEFPEEVSDVTVINLSKSSGKFKPVKIKKYQHAFFNRVGTQNTRDVAKSECFSVGEELELTISYTYNGVQKTSVVTSKILPAT